MEFKKPDKLNQNARIFAGALLPTFLGIVVFYLLMPGKIRASDIIDPINVIILSFAFVVIIIPSVIYSYIMEFIVNPNISNNFLAVVVSLVLGCLSGFVTGLGLFMGIIGAIVGLVLGVILRWLYVVSPSTNSKCNA